MDHLKVFQGLIAARDGLNDAYKRLGAANYEIANDDLVLPKIDSALIEIRQSTELFEDIYEVVERDIDYDRAKKLGAAVERNLWTVVEGDGGRLYVTAGWAHVNRLEYLLTAEEWRSEDETWLWSKFDEDDDQDEGDEDDSVSDEALLPKIDHESFWRRMGLDRTIDPDLLICSVMDMVCEIVPTCSDPSQLRPRFESRIDELLELIPEDFRPTLIPSLCEFGYRRPEHRG